MAEVGRVASDSMGVSEQVWASDEPTPALEAAPNGLAMRIGDRFEHWHPVAAFIAGVVVCYLALASASILLGLFLANVILPLGGIEEADARVPEWLAERRTETRNDASFFGSEVSGGIFLPLLVGVIAIAFAVRKHWRHAIFLISALALESAT